MIREILDLRVDHLKVFRAYLIQKLEAIAGFLFLFLGSGLQIYEETQGQTTAGRPGWGVAIVITLAVMALIALLFHAVCSFFSRRIFVELLRDMVIRHRFPLRREESLTRQIGEILRIPVGEDETVESYANKVLRRLNLPVEEE
jgi:hypothetical protein